MPRKTPAPTPSQPPAPMVVSIDALIDRATLRDEILRCSDSTLDRLVAVGTIPKPAIYVGRAARWSARAIAEWQAGLTPGAHVSTKVTPPRATTVAPV